MSTFSTDYRIPRADASVLRAIGTRILTAALHGLGAVDAWVFDRLERSRRDEHERFLSRATDVFELDRLERQWERRRLDTWTSP